jgi:hypothetical protein
LGAGTVDSRYWPRYCHQSRLGPGRTVSIQQQRKKIKHTPKQYMPGFHAAKWPEAIPVHTVIPKRKTFIIYWNDCSFKEGGPGDSVKKENRNGRTWCA